MVTLVAGAVDADVVKDVPTKLVKAVTEVGLVASRLVGKIRLTAGDLGHLLVGCHVKVIHDVGEVLRHHHLDGIDLSVELTRAAVGAVTDLVDLIFVITESLHPFIPFIHEEIVLALIDAVAVAARLTNLTHVTALTRATGTTNVTLGAVTTNNGVTLVTHITLGTIGTVSAVEPVTSVKTVDSGMSIEAGIALAALETLAALATRHTTISSRTFTTTETRRTAITLFTLATGTARAARCTNVTLGTLETIKSSITLLTGKTLFTGAARNTTLSVGAGAARPANVTLVATWARTAIETVIAVETVSAVEAIESSVTLDTGAAGHTRAAGHTVDTVVASAQLGVNDIGVEILERAEVKNIVVVAGNDAELGAVDVRANTNCEDLVHICLELSGGLGDHARRFLRVTVGDDNDDLANATAPRKDVAGNKFHGLASGGTARHGRLSAVESRHDG